MEFCQKNQLTNDSIGKKSRATKADEKNIFFPRSFVFFLSKKKKFFRPFLFFFVVSEEININGVCVCLFRCAHGAQPTVSKCACVCVLCTSDSFAVFFCSRIHDESVQALIE